MSVVYAHIVAEDSCCGCGACSNICPHKCIHMQENQEGFLMPYVDEASCIQCGACKMVCPVLCRNVKEKKGESLFYGCKNIDDSERRRSSSGAIFPLLAELIIRENGVVYGVSFVDGNRAVSHISITESASLCLLRGSKYLQSDTKESFLEIRQQLRDGITVLFSGTPCQIAALKCFLGNTNQEHLYCVDLVCHGVPSGKAWRAYLSQLEREAESTAVVVHFRDKLSSWRNSDFVVKFKNGKELRLPNNQNPFMRGFIKNLYVRESCSQCKFKSFASGSDMTIGDFWGATEIEGGHNDDIGISVVALHTEKGRALFREIRESLKDIIQVDEKSGYLFNESVKDSAKFHENRTLFFEMLGKENFDSLVFRLTPVEMAPKYRLSNYMYSMKRILRLVLLKFRLIH